MKFLCPLFIAVLLSGCTGMPGHIESRNSMFDGSTEISMTPAWIMNGMQGFRVGLHRTSKMPPGELVLTALVMDAVTISEGPSLKFNIDGEIVALTASDSMTSLDFKPGLYNSVASIPGHSESSRRYPVTVDLVRRLVESTNCTARLDLSRDYLEGRFSTDSPTTARPAFRRFLAALSGTNSVTRPQPSKTGKGAN